MREIGLIAQNEYLRQIRRKAFLWTTLFLPLVIAGVGLIGFLLVSASAQERALGVVDESGRFAAVQATETGDIPIEHFPDRATARTALDAGKIGAVVAIPRDYLQTGTVEVIAQRALSMRAQQTIHDLLHRSLLASLPVDVRARADRPMTLLLKTANVARTIDSENILVVLLPILFALLFIITAFTTNGYLLQVLADEKENRIMEILATSLRPAQMMAGKIVGLGAVGLTQIAAWSAWGVAAVLLIAPVRQQFISFNLPWITLVEVALFFLLGYLLIAGCYAAIGAAVTAPQEGQQFAGPLSLLTIAPLWLLVAILAQPNGKLAVILSLFPFTAPITMMVRLSLTTIPLWQTLLSLLLLLAAAIGAIYGAAGVLRRGMLHYGKRMTLREIFGGRTSEEVV